MNDEFLQALRREPPPRFASELKRRLDRQSARSRRSTTVRTLLAVLLIGGVAMAAALLLRNREEPAPDSPQIAHTAAPSAPATKAEATRRARPAQQAPAAASEAPQPQTEKATAADRPAAIFATSSLALPIARALVEHASTAGSSGPQAALMEAADAFRALCGPVEMVVASRRILPAELTLCVNRGVEVVEWKLGYQAVVVTAGPTAERASLSPREMYLALARRVPDPANRARLIDNPNMTWHDVDTRFDSRSIDVMAPTDATLRHAFVHLIMEPGCDTYTWIRDLKQTNRKRYDAICHELRGDGRFREVELSNTLITQQLWAEPNWLVILSYSFYARHRDELLPTMLDGPEPTSSSLESGTYAAAAPVYVYANRDALFGRALRMLAYELTNGWAVGPQGYLGRSGLVSLTDAQRPIQDAWPAAPLKVESLPPIQEHRR